MHAYHCRGMLELARVLWTVFLKSRDIIQTVEKNLDHFFSSWRKNIFNIFFKIFEEKIWNFWNFEIQNFQNVRFQNVRKSQISEISDFHIFFDFSDENFEKPHFWKIFSKHFFAEAKNIFLIQIFYTVWIMSLDFKKTVQSTQVSSSMPRKWIAFWSCL